MTKRDERLLEARERHWPKAEGEIFDPGTGKGYARVPRTVPMVAGLIDSLDTKNAGRLYTTLWAHDWGHGIIEVKDPEALIFEAGYRTRNRAHRNWLERMQLLEKFAFIKTQPIGPRIHGLVLLRDPHRVVSELAMSDDVKLDAMWLDAFKHRCREIGIDLGPYEGLA